MKYTTKMVMIPEHALSQMNVMQQRDGIEGRVDEFKNALQKILSDVTLPAETQMQLYNQLFTRYLKIDADSKEPTTVITRPDKPTENVNEQIESIKKSEPVDDKWKRAIVEKMPKTHLGKADELIDFLSNSKQFSIHDNGEISINDKIVPQSNVVKLIHDVIRDRPKAPPPLGLGNFVTLLRDLNVPKYLIGNPTRWNMIKEEFRTPESKTPKTKVKRKLKYTDQQGSGLVKRRPKYSTW